VNFPADLVGLVFIFDILHNGLQRITVASWRSQRICLKALLTHRQYDRQEWEKWV
jgi:mRNA-degrading endonuclease HigB of HigAB toxin-antitoxin module